MELVYVYICNLDKDKNKKIQNIGVNLSEKYKITYDSDKNKLNIEESESYVENFWNTTNELQTNSSKASIDKDGTITGVHAIVGDNGSGKTTVLKFIMDFFNQEHLYLDQIGFFVFFNKKDMSFIVICCGGNYDHKGFDTSKPYTITGYDFKTIFGIKKSSNGEYFHDNDKIAFDIISSTPMTLYINNILDFNDYSKGVTYYVEDRNTLNLSTGYLINYHPINQLTSQYKSDIDYDKLTNFFNSEILNQFGLLINSKELHFNLPFKPPESLKIDIDSFNYAYYINKIIEINENEQYLSKTDYYILNKSKLVDLFRIDIERNLFKNRNNKDKTIILLSETVVRLVILSIFPEEKEYKEKYEILFKTLSKFNFSEDDNIKNIIVNYKTFIHELDVKINAQKPFFSSYENFLDYLSKNIETISHYITSENDPFLEISPEDSNIDFLNSFLDRYAEISQSYRFLDFSWGLSSGEYTLLNLYSRLYSKVDKINRFGDGSNLLILMDEPDVTLHPSWQQKYIKSLVDFLPSIYKDCNIKIVITTHSPIMLSDIPKQNVTFIKDGKVYPKEVQMETFGANIHNLFRDSFFMDNTIGTFAYEKINAVIAWLKTIEKHKNEGSYNEDKTKEEDMKKVIDSIGEPLIRNKLTKMYNDIFREKLGLDAQIRQYKDDIMKLQNYIKNSAAIDKTTLRNLNEDLERTSKQIQNIINKSGDKND